jgi:hypothetical protein
VLLAGAPEAGAQQAAASSSRHLIEGVRAFREGRFSEALVEFRIVERAPDAPPELAFYLGPTLYKLGRHREALRVFLASRAERDALTNFYLATTCYQLRLYRLAREVFAKLHEGGLGPKLAGASARYVIRIDELFSRPVPPGVIDGYLAEARVELERGDPFTGGAFLEEALRIHSLTPSRPASRALSATVASAWTAARAYLDAGDRFRARPLLQALAHVPGAEAAEAQHLLLAPPR